MLQKLLNKLPFNSRSKNTIWLLLEQILKMITGFTIGIWVTRYLGPEKYGMITYSNSLVGIIGTIVPLGLIGFIVRELVKEEKEYNRILGTTFWLRLIGGTVGFVIIFIITILDNRSLVEDLVLIIISFQLITQSFDTIDLYFQSKTQNFYSVISRCIPLIIFAVIRVGVILFDLGIIFIALTYSLEFLFSSYLLTYFYNKQNRRIIRWKFECKLAKSYLQNTIPLIFASLSAMVYLKVDQLMLSWMVGEAEVGIYAAAARLSEMWYFIPGVLVTSLYPILIKLKSTDKPQYLKQLQATLNSFVTINILIIIFISVFADIIIMTLYGNQFVGSADILKLHIWSSLFIFIRVLLNKWFIIENLLNYQLYNELLGASTNIILNLILIPKFGGLGAALATLLSYIIATYVVTFINPKTRVFSLMVTKAFVLGIFKPTRGIFKFSYLKSRGK